MDIGDPLGLTFAGYDVQLLAGSSVLAEDANTTPPSPGAFSTSTLTFTSGPADPRLGARWRFC